MHNTYIVLKGPVPLYSVQGYSERHTLTVLSPCNPILSSILYHAVLLMSFLLILQEETPVFCQPVSIRYSKILPIIFSSAETVIKRENTTAKPWLVTLDVDVRSLEVTVIPASFILSQAVRQPSSPYHQTIPVTAGAIYQQYPQVSSLARARRMKNKIMVWHAQD